MLVQKPGESMPQPRPPTRLIQTTLTYEGKSASFIWVEGGKKALGELLASRGTKTPVFRGDVKIPLNTDRSEVYMHWAARCIDDPFSTKNAPLDFSVVRNRELPWIEALLDSQQVVITQSPPTLTSFKLLAQKAGGVVVGAWLGYEVGSDLARAVGSPMLLFATVPAGMLVLSATAGISKGLETGLNQWLVERMTGAARRRRKLKPKRKTGPRKKLEGLTEPTRAKALSAYDGGKILTEDGRALTLEQGPKKNRR